jgi:hypothetical protein
MIKTTHKGKYMSVTPEHQPNAFPISDATEREFSWSWVISRTDFISDEYDEKSKFVPVNACIQIVAISTTHFLDSPTIFLLPSWRFFLQFLLPTTKKIGDVLFQLFFSVQGEFGDGLLKEINCCLYSFFSVFFYFWLLVGRGRKVEKHAMIIVPKEREGGLVESLSWYCL